MPSSRGVGTNHVLEGWPNCEVEIESEGGRVALTHGYCEALVVAALPERRGRSIGADKKEGLPIGYRGISTYLSSAFAAVHVVCFSEHVEIELSIFFSVGEWSSWLRPAKGNEGPLPRTGNAEVGALQSGNVL